MKMSFSLFFLSLHLLFFLRPIAARRFSNATSGFVDKSYRGSRRHLVEDDHFQKLDKLSRGYMTNADLEKAIMALSNRCSSISRTYSIGKSILGVPLWVIEFSDKPREEEAEPAFKFIGNVHGDEPVGREILLLLANWLCDNYKKDDLATLIVEKVHLHILPSMNPDGYSQRTRGNANNIDLNRDFPDQFFPINDDMDTRQPETKAIMNWLKETIFTASASFHGGALVANYPWDGTEDKKKNYYACPDDKTFKYLASLYSQSHSNMSMSKEFEGGITNGALWYPIYGGMQDWNYIHGCFELTLEISDNKWPPINEISTIWEFNKMSMLNLVASLVKTGVHGKIFSSDYGRPLAASVVIKGINSTIKASETLADYHRLLVPGEYEVIAKKTGYKTRSTRILLGQEAMTVDFVLDPEIFHDGMLPRSGCYYPGDSDNFSRIQLLDYVPGTQLQIISFFLVISLIFLCFLKMRRITLNQSKHRQPVWPRRSVAV